MEAKKNLKDISLLGNGLKLYIDYHQTKMERSAFLKLKLIKINENHRNIRRNPQLGLSLRPFQAYMNFLQRQFNQRIIPYNAGNNSVEKMDSNARNEYFGEKLYTKISKMSQFNKYSNYFTKIVGIFLDLDDNVLDKLIKDDKYFIEQIQETIKLLTEKEKPN